MGDNKVDTSEFKFYISVKLSTSQKAYFFGLREDMDIHENDFVVIETERGIVIGQSTIDPIPIERYSGNLGLKPVLRKATEEDLKQHDANMRDAVFALQICEKEVRNLNLDMHLINAEYTLDRTKITFTYSADERVDFRELLKVLAHQLRTRIELRQIGSRDKAKTIGGLGICGLPICCATFLNKFDTVGIARAKNQMLAINIPKLSGHCEKLICCLAFEDDTYTEAKKDYPELGSKIWMDKKEYVVTSINIVNTIVKIEGPEDDIQFLTLDELRKNAKFRPARFNKKKDETN